MKEFIIKKANDDVLKELKSIKFDVSYCNIAKNKYKGCSYKIFALKPYEANILKQICLSLGFDCAVSRDTVTCKCETTDCIIFATDIQYKKLIQKLNQQPFRLKTLAKQLNEIINNKLSTLTIRNYVFDWTRPYIMGILNVTPDSFSDGGKYNTIETAFLHCKELIENGADIIDIGGESTRPNADIITTEEEIKRVIPVIKEIRENGINIPISVDTRNYETARRAIDEGADIINDVSGLNYDKNLFDYVTKNNIPTVIMHSNKVPAVSSSFTECDVVEEIYKSFDNKIETLTNSGLDKKNIIIDIGIGFGKSVDGNFELLKRINEFTTLNIPLLLGISRKSFICKTFDITPQNADITTALYSSMLKEVNIHRVHNVKLTKQFLNFSCKIKKDSNF